MCAWLRLLVLLIAGLMVIGVAIPPVTEDRLETGFCSADCPVQHAGHGTAVGPPPAPTAAHRLAIVAAPIARETDPARSTPPSPDVPRAPPSD